MSTINPVLLYGPTGQPISSQRRFLHAAGNTPAHEPWATVYEDDRKSTKTQDRHFVVSSARKLYANLGFIREAIDGKALASLAQFLPKYTGTDPVGAIAQAWLRDEWCPSCEIRGEGFDWATCKYLESTNVDHSGDIGVLLTYKGDPKRPWPCIQLVPAHRVSLRNAATREGVIQGDECAGAENYKGRNFEDGVIFGDYGDPIAYALVGETTDQDQIVSSRSLLMLKEPVWIGQARGLPAFFHGILEARSVMTTQEREAFAGVIGSSIALMEQNETGGPEGVPSANTDPTIPTTTLDGGGNALQIQSYLGGLVRYFRSGSGANLKSFTSTRPGEAWESFQNRLVKMACAPVWPDELCWQMGKLTGPAVRAVQGKARRFVTDRQSLIGAASRREITFALAIAQATGRIPKFTSKNWAKEWDFVRPPRITIDDGRDGAAKLNDYFAGLINLSDLLEEDGRERDSHLNTRAWDIVKEEQTRRRVSAEANIPGWEIPPERMHRAVGSAANNSAPATAESDAEQDSKDDAKTDNNNEK